MAKFSLLTRYAITVPVLLAAFVCAGCLHPPSKLELPHRAEASPAGPVVRTRVAKTCPNLSGIYSSQTLQGEVMRIQQQGCAKITIHNRLKGIFDHAYTYHLDGTSQTVRQYAMHTETYVAYFEGEELVLVGRGKGYTSYEHLKLVGPDKLHSKDYAIRDSGNRYNELLVRYVRMKGKTPEYHIFENNGKTGSEGNIH